RAQSVRRQDGGVREVPPGLPRASPSRHRRLRGPRVSCVAEKKKATPEEWPKSLIQLVGGTGFEPVTPTMSRSGDCNKYNGLRFHRVAIVHVGMRAVAPARA